MIDPNVLYFPMNIVQIIALIASDLGEEELDPKDRLNILKRPLRPEDKTQSIGITPLDWSPELGTRQMGHGRAEPMLQQYRILVQGMVKSGSEEEAIHKHSVLSYLIRQMLYRDKALEVGLSELSVSLGGSVEKFARKDVLTQDYGNNDVDKKFVYLSATEFLVETTTINY